jgi:hypothetical protein
MVDRLVKVLDERDQDRRRVAHVMVAFGGH